MLDILLSWPAATATAAALLAVAWFVPGLRRYALFALGVFAAAFALRKSGERAGRADKQEEWDNAEQDMERRAREVSHRVREVVDRAADDDPRRVRRPSPYDRHHRNK